MRADCSRRVPPIQPDMGSIGSISSKDSYYQPSAASMHFISFTTSPQRGGWWPATSESNLLTPAL